jgi:hypothetical protein
VIPPVPDLATGGETYAHVRTVDFTAMVNSDVQAGWLPRGDFQLAPERPSTPVTRYTFDVDTARSATPTGAELRHSAGGQQRGPRASPLPERGSSHEAAVRLELLVRKSAGGLSSEEQARLLVATERLRTMLPRVTPADFEALAEVAEKVAGSGLKAKALRDELGFGE